MLIGNQLIATVAKLPTISLAGVAFRTIHIKHLNTCLSSIGSLQFGGRYNPPLAFETLYLADHPLTSLLEVETLVKVAASLQRIPKPPQLVLSVEYKLSAVFDLTNLENQRALSTNLQELTGNWRLLNGLGHVASTQVLGEVAFSVPKIEALKVPSARNPKTYNLVVFPDKLLDSNFVRVYDDSGSIRAQLP